MKLFSTISRLASSILLAIIAFICETNMVMDVLIMVIAIVNVVLSIIEIKELNEKK